MSKAVAEVCGIHVLDTRHAGTYEGQGFPDIDLWICSESLAQDSAVVRGLGYERGFLGCGRLAQFDVDLD